MGLLIKEKGITMKKIADSDRTKESRKPDHRTQMTRAAIRDALLVLLKKTSFDKISIAPLCREAGISRATFYSHYNGLAEVLDELFEEAIQVTSAGATSFAQLSEVRDRMQKTNDLSELAALAQLLPVCQRISDNPKFRVLFTDPFVSEHILMRLYQHQRKLSVPDYMKTFGLSCEEADKLFLFMITGAFAVNKSMDWKKDASWYDVQKVLLTFITGGCNALKKK